MLTPIDISRTVEELYTSPLVQNFQKYVSKRTKIEIQKRNLFNTVYNVLYLLEYERLKNLSDQIISLHDDTLISSMDFSEYTPETTFEQLRVETDRVRGNWSRKIGKFPVQRDKMGNVRTIGEMAEKIYRNS